MSDIVEVAVARHCPAGGRPMTWFVSLTNGKDLNGTIKSLGNGNYEITHREVPYYFTADKVVSIYPGR